MNVDDTIAAIASPPGGALRGIVRLSGLSVADCLQRCFQSADGSPLPTAGPPAVLAGHLVVAPPVGELPCDLHVWPGRRSYTRQPVAEIHTFGSPPLLDAALRTVCAAGARLAEPGEFTLRAFLAGRIDLTQAEAVLGVIDAQGRDQLELALKQMAGGLANPLQEIRTQLLDLLADLEAGLDFVDEDIQFISETELHERLSELESRLERLSDQIARRSETPETFRVALVGWPNVGKSCLLNALAGESVSIVADGAGTTRDYVTRRITIQGLECLLVDTAGIEPNPLTPIDEAAQLMGGGQVDAADLLLWCIDGTRHLDASERQALHDTAVATRIVVLTKGDQVVSTNLHIPAIVTSSRTGIGLESLRSEIFKALSRQQNEEAGVVGATAARCGESLRRAFEAVRMARCDLSSGIGDDIVAVGIRAALDELAQVVGAVYTEDVLDRVFSRFCIGK